MPETVSECIESALPRSNSDVCAVDENCSANIFSAIQCVALDWGATMFKMHTNFHVPEDYHGAAGAFTPSSSHHPHYLPGGNDGMPVGRRGMTVPYVHPRLDAPVPPLHLPWYFGVLCWSFFLGGFVMLRFPPTWALCGGGRARGRRGSHRRHWFPFTQFALVLMLVQSPCSFLADYVHMTDISIWHVTDRFLACILMVLEVAKIIVMRPYTRPLVYFSYLVCCGGAGFSFAQSQASQEALDAEGFVFWHCGWHCYPLAAIVTRFVEMHLDRRWGEYHNFDRAVEREAQERGYKRGESGGLLLSTIAMHYWNHAKKKQPEGPLNVSCNGAHGDY